MRAHLLSYLLLKFTQLFSTTSDVIKVTVEPLLKKNIDCPFSCFEIAQYYRLCILLGEGVIDALTRAAILLRQVKHSKLSKVD